MREATTRLNTFLKIHAKQPAYAQNINDVKMFVKCICTFYNFRAGNINSLTLLNEFTVTYRDNTDDHMYSNTLIHLELFKSLWRGFLCSMVTVVDLINGNSYLVSLFMWCMSGTPRVFDGKTCAHDKLIHVVHVWCAMCI